MNCFQLVNTVLTDLYEEIVSENGTRADKIIKKRLEELHEYYGTKERRIKVSPLSSTRIPPH